MMNITDRGQLRIANVAPAGTYTLDIDWARLAVESVDVNERHMDGSLRTTRFYRDGRREDIGTHA